MQTPIVIGNGMMVHVRTGQVLMIGGAKLMPVGMLFLQPLVIVMPLQGLMPPAVLMRYFWDGIQILHLVYLIISIEIACFWVILIAQPM